MRLPKDLVAASAKPIVLSLLRRGDSYGYDIVQQVRDLSGGHLEWKEGMLYPLLHRLETNGLIESYEGSAAGRTRKYYRILPAGIEELEGQREGFRRVIDILHALDSRPLGGAHV